MLIDRPAKMSTLEWFSRNRTRSTWLVFPPPNSFRLSGFPATERSALAATITSGPNLLFTKTRWVLTWLVQTSWWPATMPVPSPTRLSANQSPWRLLCPRSPPSDLQSPRRLAINQPDRSNRARHGYWPIQTTDLRDKSQYEPHRPLSRRPVIRDRPNQRLHASTQWPNP